MNFSIRYLSSSEVRTGVYKINLLMSITLGSGAIFLNILQLVWDVSASKVRFEVQGYENPPGKMYFFLTSVCWVIS